MLRRGGRVIAHVRCADPAAGLARVEATARAYGLWSEEDQDRIIVVPGDITKPLLGMAAVDWERVKRETDIVVHNGAQVHWMLPYSSLRAANVLSTLECIRLCSPDGGDGSRPKRLVYLSSTSALDTEHYVLLSKKGAVPESDDLDGSRKGLQTGYAQAKWASEYLVREAGRRGLAGAIVRPGYVTGDPGTGASVTDDFVVRMWKACLQVGARPDIDNSMNAVPITRVSRIVVAAALFYPGDQPEAAQQNGHEQQKSHAHQNGAHENGHAQQNGHALQEDSAASPATGRTATSAHLGVVNVTSRPRMTANEWLRALETYGYNVPQVPYADWSARLKAYVAAAGEEPQQQRQQQDGDVFDEEEEEEKDTRQPKEKEELALLPLFHYVTGNLPADWVAPRLDDRSAGAVLRADGTGRDVDEDAGLTVETMGMYLSYLVATGFLPPPSRAGHHGVLDLPRCQLAAGKVMGGRGTKRS